MNIAKILNLPFMFWGILLVPVNALIALSTQNIVVVIVYNSIMIPLFVLAIILNRPKKK